MCLLYAFCPFNIQSCKRLSFDSSQRPYIWKTPFAGYLPAQGVVAGVEKIPEYFSCLIKWDICTPEVATYGDQTPLKHSSGNIYGFRCFFSLFSFTSKKVKKCI